MTLKRLLALLLVFVVILTATAGCGAKGSNAIELVPQGANLIASIQVNKIINDQDIRDAYDEMDKEPGQPRTVDDLLDEVIRETGIDIRDISKATVFVDVTSLEQAEYIGLIIEGSFDEEEFIENIEWETGEGFTTSDYKGYQLYTDEWGEYAIAFLSDTMLLFGTPKAVKDAIDVSEGDRDSVEGAILDTYNRLDDALIKLAMRFPEEAREAIIEEPAMDEMPISLESFADIDMLGFALDKQGENLSIQITPHFLSKDSAMDAEDTITGTISLFKGILTEPEVKELLDKIEVTVDNSWMTIAFEITISEIEELAETFQ